MRVLLYFIIMSFIFTGPVKAENKVRTYYIAADTVLWDYTPSGINQIYNRAFNEDEMFFLGKGQDRLGSKFKKAQYREYTDETFTTLKPIAKKWKHLGILGPVIRAEVGEKIKIVFKNNAPFPVSMHPHGVFYLKDSEGAPYDDGTAGDDKKDDAVPTGGIHVYNWNVPDRAGPKGDQSTKFWMYHSHANEVRDVNAGLMGPMIITARGKARDDLSPTDVDHEFIILFTSMEETASWYIQENMEMYYKNVDNVKVARGPFGLHYIMGDGDPSQGIYENMNGFLYGNMPMLTMKKGDKVRWYLMGGTNFEVHAPHWHANSGDLNGMQVDTTSLLTMGMQVINMEPDAVGKWLFHCHVASHFEAGMVARYEVLPKD